MECSLFMKRTFTEKLNIVIQALSGVPQRRLCAQYHLGQHYLENLIDRYRKYGEEGLYRKAQKKISPDFKVKLVRDFIEKEYLCVRFAMRMKLAGQPLSPGCAKRVPMDMIHCEQLNDEDDPQKIWHGQRKENRKQNWRNFRQRTYALGQRTHC